MDNVINNLNTILNKLYSSIKNDGYNILDNISDIDESIFEKEPIKSLYQGKNMDNFLLMINIIISAVIIYYAFKSILSLYGDTSIENIYFFVIKIIIVSILSFNSFSICKQIVNINYLITESVESILEEVSDKEISYNFLEGNISNLDDFFKTTDKIGINGIKDSIVCAYIVSMIIFFSIRYVIILVCIILSPFAFLSIVFSKKRFLFNLWKKVFISNLSIQIINKIIIFIPTISINEKDVCLPILIGTVFIIYKINKIIGDVKIYG